MTRPSSLHRMLPGYPEIKVLTLSRYVENTEAALQVQRLAPASWAAADLTEALPAIQMGTWQVVCIDLDAPEAIIMLKQLRAAGLHIPVLCITQQSTWQARVQALDAGADDCISIPIGDDELAARLRALSRRGLGSPVDVIRHGDLVYDPLGRKVHVADSPVSLSARELMLLDVMIRRSGRSVSKSQLLSALSDIGEHVSANAVEVYVHRLRRKLGRWGVGIVTQRGEGYRLETPANAAQETGSGYAH